MDADYQWDAGKARKNARKHEIELDEAITVFTDPPALSYVDEAHLTALEDRYKIIGQSEQGRLLVVIFTELDDIIRIISARKTTRAERRFYENER